MKNRQKEEQLSKKMLGLDKYEAEKKKKKANDKAWRLKNGLTIGLIMGGVGALLGGLVAWFRI